MIAADVPIFQPMKAEVDEKIQLAVPAVPKMPLPELAFFNGQVVPYGDVRLGLLTHALNYGTAVFGGLRAFWNEDERELFVFRPLDHFRRFLDSARLLRMELAYTAADLWTGLRELLRRQGSRADLYIRALAFYGDETLGVRLHGLRPEVSMVALPFGHFVPNDDDAHACISSWQRLSDNVLPARGKIAGGYVSSALAKSDAQLAGFDEALVLNDDGHVCEGSVENLFVVRGGVAATPPVTQDILEGITRRTVIQLLREDLGVEVVERPIDRTEIYLAEEVFLTGTGVQTVAVTRVDHRPIGSGRMGEIAARLRPALADVVRGKDPRRRDWCAAVYRGDGG
jgi:branched-chain amino acid aminotransferase